MFSISQLPPNRLILGDYKAAEFSHELDSIVSISTFTIASAIPATFASESASTASSASDTAAHFSS